MLALLRQKKAPHVRLAAARDILDRTLGRPQAKVELTGALDLSGLRARLGAMPAADVERLADLLGNISLSVAEQQELSALRIAAGLEDA